ncbi:MAG TPA: phage terminase large subunit [Gemmatimonadales bacterium]|nr:phage terminase large subunit [Gemmatimonadales bacterium]
MPERHDRRLDAVKRKLDRDQPRPEPPADREGFEQDLLAFVRAGWQVLEPRRPFVVNWHHELLAEYLTAVSRRQILKLIVNVPPRFTKSRFATVLWPCWSWAKAPEHSWIFGSYAAGLSTRHSLDRRTVLQSDWYQQRWGERVAFAPDQNVKLWYENQARGTMYATSTGGTVMGFGADTIVVDDPHDPESVLSETERETALRWFDQQLSTRLNDPATGAIVVIMQRLHQADLTGHLLEEGDWTHVALPAESEGPTRIVFPVSGRVVERADGALLWAERFTQAVLDKQRIRLGSWAYAGQFQQRPTPFGGGIFKRDWFRFYDVTPTLFDSSVASWDLAFKETKGTDYVVGQVWGRKGANCYLLDQVRGRWDFPTTVQRIRELARKWPGVMTKLVEDKANGPAVIATLKNDIGGMIAVNPEGGKIVRAQAVSALIEAGNVLLPQPALQPWVKDFLDEASAFPAGRFDDQVDAMTQALRRLVGAGDAKAWAAAFWGLRPEDLPDKPLVPLPAVGAAGASFRELNPVDGSFGKAGAAVPLPGGNRLT